MLKINKAEGFLALSVMILLTAASLMLPLVGGSALAMDRSDLDRVLETIPPNGPFWKYGNVNMRSRSRAAGMPTVIFTHWDHRARYACRVCHVELGFSMRLGGSGITRKQYVDGAFCGACHDGKIAFNARNKDAECGRCHLKVTSEMQKRFESFASDLPVANFGNGIDWPKAKREHLIKPSLSLKNPTVIMPLPDKLKIPLKLGTTSPRSDVLFSHEDHFPELDCSNCHPDLFNIQKKGTETFTMDNNIFGYYCGACHLLVAFPMNNCRRCHPQMQNRSSF